MDAAIDVSTADASCAKPVALKAIIKLMPRLISIRLATVISPANNAHYSLSSERIFTWAAWADKHDGRVHDTAARQFTFALHEPVGTIGIACPDAWPLLAFLATTMPAGPVRPTRAAIDDRLIVTPSPDAFR